MIRIGLSVDLHAPPGELPSYQLKRAYADAVARAGALPLLLPLLPDEASVRAALSVLDGLVITGGAFDIPPALYGQAPREGLGPQIPERSASEARLGRAAMEASLPILGVCGGMQLLNVLHGGTLVQDLARERPEAGPHEQAHDKRTPAHDLDVVAGSRLDGLLAPGERRANSTHHQAVDVVGQRLRVVARAPDGIVEAFEGSGETFVLGVQWHPELLVACLPSHQRIYDALVEAAQNRRDQASPA